MGYNDTEKLLRECNAGIKMGVNAIDGVMSSVRSHTLKEKLKAGKDAHAKLGSETHKLLNERGEGGKSTNAMARRMASMKTSMKLAFMPGDRSVAELITDGCNMGIKSLSRYRNQYVNASPKAKEIADELIRIEEGLSHDMRGYL